MINLYIPDAKCGANPAANTAGFCYTAIRKRYGPKKKNPIRD